MTQYKNKIKEKKEKEKETDIMMNILYLYIKELSDDLIKNISHNIITNFLTYKQNMINKKLKNIFNIYYIKEQLYLKNKFYHWNQNLINLNENNNNINDEIDKNNYFSLNLNVGPIMNNSSGVPIIINNNNNNKKIIKSELDNNNNDIDKNNKNKKKYKYLRNNITSMNKSNSLPNMNINISLNKQKKKRSYSSDNSKSKKKIEFNNKKIAKLKTKKNKDTNDKIDEFIRRQEIFKKNNYYKKENIIKDNEDENKLIYTFEPKINDSLRKLYKNDNISVENRLYNDSIIRRNKKLEKENNIININLTKNIFNKKAFNPKKIMELYEDYNLRKEKNEKLVKKIDQECGYTYAPNVFHKKNGGQGNSYGTHTNNNKNKKLNKKINKNNSCDKIYVDNKNKLK